MPIVQSFPITCLIRQQWCIGNWRGRAGKDGGRLERPPSLHQLSGAISIPSPAVTFSYEDGPIVDSPMKGDKQVFISERPFSGVRPLPSRNFLYPRQR